MSTFRDRITIDPAVCHGKPVVRGLRYPVEMILHLKDADFVESSSSIIGRRGCC